MWGKSSFINRMIRGGSAGKAEVQDRPGVTRQNRWFTVGKGFELLDTPGVLWPKFEDPIVGEHLAFTGAVRDEILDVEGLASRLLELLMELTPTRSIPGIKPASSRMTIDRVSAFGSSGPQAGHADFWRRGQHRAGGNHRLDEYRGGRLGRITLERP